MRVWTQRCLKYTVLKLRILLTKIRFGPYFVEPIVAGLDPKTFEPFLSVCDLIGQPCFCNDFAVIGTSNEQLYGMCETLWTPDLVSGSYFVF